MKFSVYSFSGGQSFTWSRVSRVITVDQMDDCTPCPVYRPMVCCDNTTTPRLRGSVSTYERLIAVNISYTQQSSSPSSSSSSSSSHLLLVKASMLLSCFFLFCLRPTAQNSTANFAELHPRVGTVLRRNCLIFTESRSKTNQHIGKSSTMAVLMLL